MSSTDCRYPVAISAEIKNDIGRNPLALESSNCTSIVLQDCFTQASLQQSECPSCAAKKVWEHPMCNYLQHIGKVGWGEYPTNSGCGWRLNLGSIELKRIFLVVSSHRNSESIPILSQCPSKLGNFHREQTMDRIRSNEWCFISMIKHPPKMCK